MKYSIEIANEFIRRALAENKSLTQMQLQKLVYIAHGWYLAIKDKALSCDSPEAWNYGPVYPRLWKELRSYGKNAVTEEIKLFDYDSPFSEEESEFIKKIYTLYAGYHAFQLSAMTHKEDTPWYKKYVVEGNRKGMIDDISIKKHFKEIAQARNNGT